MKLQQTPHRSTVSDNNLIPMINVVFLLLIFFMVAGVVRTSDPLSLKAPESTGANPLIAQSVLYVAGDGTLILDETSLSMASLETTLAKLKDNPATTDTSPDIASQKPGGNTPRKPQNESLLAIKADAQVSVSLLRDILHAVTDAGLPRVELITTWVPTDTR